MYLLPLALQSQAHVAPINKDFSKNKMHLFHLHALYTNQYNQPLTVNLTILKTFYWTTLLSLCFASRWLVINAMLEMELQYSQFNF